MATPATIWSTVAGAGAANGTSLADAYTHGNALAAVNALGALTQDCEWKLCGGPWEPAATVAVTKDATHTYQITMQGRNVGDTADAELVIDASSGAGNYHGITLTAADYWVFRNISVEGAGNNNHGWSIGAGADYCQFYRCQANDNSSGSLAGDGFSNSGASNTFTECYAASNGGQGFSYAYFLNCCVAENNGQAGFEYPYRSVYGCRANGNGNYGFYRAVHLVGCTAYDNTQCGILLDSDISSAVDSISEENTAYGVAQYLGRGAGLLLRVGTYNNTSGRKEATAYTIDIGGVEYTASAFVDAAGGDFRLNNDAAGGALLKSLQASYPEASYSGYPDAGAVQSKPRVIYPIG